MWTLVIVGFVISVVEMAVGEGCFLPVVAHGYGCTTLVPRTPVMRDTTSSSEGESGQNEVVVL